jgi:phospholipid/cholesterol/gamma-HCH transport system substrate-binding protein
MSRSVVETIMGAVVLGVAAFFLSTAYKNSGMQATTQSYHVSADFGDVTGIGIGSDVRIGGVKIGLVESIGLNKETYQATLNMAVQKDVALPLDTTAAIVGESLLGGKFVALAPGGDETALKEGGKIEFTQSSVSLEQLLGKFVFSGGGVGGEDGDKPANKNGASDDIDLSLP